MITASEVSKKPGAVQCMRPLNSQTPTGMRSCAGGTRERSSTSCAATVPGRLPMASNRQLTRRDRSPLLALRKGSLSRRVHGVTDHEHRGLDRAQSVAPKLGEARLLSESAEQPRSHDV